MTKSHISSHFWKLLIGLTLVAGCCADDVDELQVAPDAPSMGSLEKAPKTYLVHCQTQDTKEGLEGTGQAGSQQPGAAPRLETQEQSSAAKQALREALEALRQAGQAVNADDEAKAATALRQAVESLQTARKAPPCASHTKDCCKPYAPQNCPPIKPCTDGGDACVVVRLPSIESRNPSFTAKGTHAFTELYSAAVARGIENATIRAMNATKVCPIPPCDPQEPQQPLEEDAK